MNKHITNLQRMQDSIQNMPKDRRMLVGVIGLFLFASLLFYQDYLWWSGDRIAIPIPGMMSIIPAYNIDAMYEENFSEGDYLNITLNFCSTIQPVCIPCLDCSADLYYDYGNGKQLYEKDLKLDNGTTTIQIRTIPTWLYVGFNATYYNFIRIPDPSILDYIMETSKGFTNKLTFFSTWFWLVTLVIAILSIIKWMVVFIKNKIGKGGKDKVDYIG